MTSERRRVILRMVKIEAAAILRSAADSMDDPYVNDEENELFFNALQALAERVER